MAFKDNTLIFSDTKIIDESGVEVMMDWETPIMEKAAEFICHNNGDITIDANGTGEIAVTSPVGFGHQAATVGSTGDITDMPINYVSEGNKCRLTFTGDTQTFTNLQLVFPVGVSGNFVILVKTYSAGAVTTNAITNFLAYSGSTIDTPSAVLWPGGAKPSITNVAARMDIFSFYWDSNEEIAYGAASQGYQT